MKTREQRIQRLTNRFNRHVKKYGGGGQFSPYIPDSESTSISMPPAPMYGLSPAEQRKQVRDQRNTKAEIQNQITSGFYPTPFDNARNLVADYLHVSGIDPRNIWQDPKTFGKQVLTGYLTGEALGMVGRGLENSLIDPLSKGAIRRIRTHTPTPDFLHMIYEAHDLEGKRKGGRIYKDGTGAKPMYEIPETVNPREQLKRQFSPSRTDLTNYVNREQPEKRWNINDYTNFGTPEPGLEKPMFDPTNPVDYVMWGPKTGRMISEVAGKLAPNMGKIPKAIKNKNYDPEVADLPKLDRETAYKQMKEGEDWFRNWISDPETKRRYQEMMLPQKDIDNIIKDHMHFYGRPSFNPSGAQSQNYEEMRNMILSRRGLKNAYKNYQNILDGKSLAKESNGLISDGTSLGQSNNLKGTVEIDINHPAFSPQNTPLPKVDVPTTTVHELTHGITAGDIGIYNSVNNKLPVANLKNASDEIKYLLEPTEIHARIMELRNQFGLKPGQIVDDNLTKQIYEKGLKAETSVDPTFFHVFPKEVMTKYMNTLPAAGAGAALGAGALQTKRHGGKLRKKYIDRTRTNYQPPKGMSPTRIVDPGTGQEYDLGGFFGDLGKSVLNAGLTGIDGSLSILGNVTGIQSLGNVINKDTYLDSKMIKPENFDDFGKIQGAVGGTVAKILPVTAPFAAAAGAVGGAVNQGFGIDAKNYDPSKQNGADRIAGGISQVGQLASMARGFQNPNAMNPNGLPPISARKFGGDIDFYPTGGFMRQIPGGTMVNEGNGIEHAEGLSHEQGGMQYSPDAEIQGGEKVIDGEYVATDEPFSQGIGKESIARRLEKNKAAISKQNSQDIKQSSIEKLKQDAIMRNEEYLQEQQEKMYKSIDRAIAKFGGNIHKKGGFMGIQKNHKGWCTPLSNPHCTGARRRLAMTLKKHHGFHEEGGRMYPGGGFRHSQNPLGSTVKSQFRSPGNNYNVVTYPGDTLTNNQIQSLATYSTTNPDGSYNVNRTMAEYPSRYYPSPIDIPKINAASQQIPWYQKVAGFMNSGSTPFPAPMHRSGGSMYPNQSVSYYNSNKFIWGGDRANSLSGIRNSFNRSYSPLGYTTPEVNISGSRNTYPIPPGYDINQTYHNSMNFPIRGIGLPFMGSGMRKTPMGVNDPENDYYNSPEASQPAPQVSDAPNSNYSDNGWNGISLGGYRDPISQMPGYRFSNYPSNFKPRTFKSLEWNTPALQDSKNWKTQDPNNPPSNLPETSPKSGNKDSFAGNSGTPYPEDNYMRYALPAVKAFRLATEKSQHLNQDDFQVKGRAPYHDISADEPRNDLMRQQYLTNYLLKNRGQLSKSSMIAGQVGTQQGIAKLYEDVGNENSRNRIAVDRTNLDNDQFNATQRFRTQDWNARADAAKNNEWASLGKDVTDLGNANRQDAMNRYYFDKFYGRARLGGILNRKFR